MNKLRLRRLKEKIRNNKNKIIIGLIIFFVVSLSTGYTLLGTTLNISGSASIGGDTCSHNITSSFEIMNSWQNGNVYAYEVKLTINNLGNEAIEDWTVTMEGPSDLATGWINGNFTNDNGIITITPPNYNRTISAQGTLEFQFNLTTSESELNLTTIMFDDCIVQGEGGSQSDPLTSLSVSPKNASVNEGETITLTISKVPIYKNITVTWVSSDTSIATVDSSGVVTGVSEGTATITASAEGLSDTATITVIHQVIPLQSLSISPNSYRMLVGEIVPLQAVPSPSNASMSLTWTSSDTSVATVDSNGSVAGVSVGTTTITATDTSGITATCNIRVAEQATVNSLSTSVAKTYAWENNFHFRITIENISQSEVYVLSFKMDIPDASTISLWANGGYTLASGNVFTADQYRAETPIEPGQSIEITGSVTLPNGESYENYPNIDLIDMFIE